ncbi:AzlC family ABC transporter permease [Desulfolutivibrio sulfoxidireducens]|uniref:AzlC family ABC transporter permease n=1 Tax=Desulfolutivibrio sulfoxidireducens TaxID=2773299 RepID=UPI00159D9121|nr:AzlC family ABC transporter permease [Desulfolutivibrio sulfoxidireducens]QLA17493.1 branched-chain amino acid ABC transporter permease [Desulfolutivibrio sulfoxidireducens]QLA21078.1 branched-chain amino acid ABC transporter permease [Desulfolutivibrio sulfoxidireducens]
MIRKGRFGPPDFLARAALRVAPVVLGYVPVGFAYGVLAKNAGLSTTNVLGMSVLVFAGSAQFIAVGMLAAGASLAGIVLTAFVVNLRHLLFSAALSPAFAAWRRRDLALVAFELTDETFALHASGQAAGPPDRAETLAVGVMAQAAWVAGSALGAWAGASVGPVTPIALDFALPAMFIALLAGQITGRLHLMVALFSGALSTIFALVGADRFGVLAATLAGAALGTLWQSLTRPTSS